MFLCTSLASTTLYSIIQALESDRRFSKSLPSIALDPSLTDRIISLALEVDILDGTVS